MRPRELNRDIKRLYKKYMQWKKGSVSFSCEQEDFLKKELERLWNADSSFKNLSVLSLKMLLVMNQSWRMIVLYHIASGIDKEKLI